MRILIVEDDKDTSLLLSKFLQKIGECEIVPNGDEGIKAYQKSFKEEEPFELICLDIMMPVMNGHETLRKIREIESLETENTGQFTKVVMISALSDGDTILQSFMELCDGYVVKPITQESLFEKLTEIGLFETQREPLDLDAYLADEG